MTYEPLTFGSVCSGIEAASQAWMPLGWTPLWFSEIDEAASRVLAVRHPSVPNYGDMCQLPMLVRTGLIEAPDVLVGGTPCQAFSVAGRREGLRDARGQLTLAYVALADAIDKARKNEGKEPCIIAWENVPGVLSSKDNAFGCFLAGLAGEDLPLEPPGGKWSDAGCVYGPERAIAWRIMDAQYAGLAQRRRRVFLVASAREDFDPAQVLFEFYGVRRDTPPSREKGEAPARNAADRTGATGSHWDGPYPHPTLNQSYNTGAIGYSNQELFSQRGSGLVGVDPQWWDGRPVSQTLDAVLHKGQTMPEKNRFPAVLQPLAFAQNTRDEVRLVGGDGGISGALAAQPGMKQTTYVACVHGTQDPDIRVDQAHTLGRNSGQENAVYASFKTGGSAQARGIGYEEQLAPTLEAGGGGNNKPGILADMAVRRLMPVEAERLQGFPDGHTLVPAKKANRKYLTNPREGYEYAQLDGEVWQLMADGPRYKMLGNSMAVPCMHWIGKRIRRYLRIYKVLSEIVG